MKKSDFEKYDYVFGCDTSNIDDLKEICPKNSKAIIELLGNHDPNGEKIIRDPYYVQYFYLKVYLIRL